MDAHHMSDADLVQRSEAWHLARAGSLGASKVREAFSRLKKGERTAAAENLLWEIAAERLTGVPAKNVNARQWGVDNEAQARETYAFLTNLPVVTVGLIQHPTIPNAHCSPDSLVGDDGGLEVKCPTSAVHLKTLLTNEIPEEHLPQIHWSLACSGRAWWDFMSHDPRFRDPRLQTFIKRVHRDESIIAAMEEDARAFLTEIEEKLKALEVRYPTEEA
jgi:hypothetical protein